MAGFEPHLLLPIETLKQEAAAAVGGRITEEHGEGKIGAAGGHEGVVHMAAIALAGAAAAKQDRVDPHWQGSRFDQRMARQGRLDLGGEALLQGALTIELAVVLHRAGMPAGGLGAAAPGRIVGQQGLAEGGHLGCTEQGFKQEAHRGSDRRPGQRCQAPASLGRSMVTNGTGRSGIGSPPAG